jgi:hypothetical protein
VRRWVSTRQWATAFTTCLLLSIIPAFTAGLAGFALAGALNLPAAGLVAATCAVTLVGMMWRFPPQPVPRESLEEPPFSETDNRRLAVILCLLAFPLSVLLTYPEVGELGDRILGNTGDSGLNVYLLEWQLHAVQDEIGAYFEPNIFDPERFTLFWGPALTPLVPFYAAAKALTGNVVTAFNILMVGVTFATLVATYLFFRKAGFGPAAGGLAAVLYATTGQRTAHLSHLDSFQTLWLPVFGYLILTLWQERRLRTGVLLGIALGASLLSAPYYFLAGLAFVGTVVCLSISDWRRLPWIGLVGTAAAALSIGLPVLLLSKAAGLNRSPDELFSVSWADFYHPGFYTPAMEWLANAASAEGGGRSIENWLFPSISLVVLGSIGAWAWLDARRGGRSALPAGHPSSLPTVLAAAGISGVLMGIGPTLEIGDAQVAMPMSAVLQLPGFEGVRVTGRFIALALLALTVVALVGANRLTTGLGEVRANLVLGAFAVVCLVTTIPVPPTVAFDASGEPTAVNRALAHRAPGLVVELPWPACPGLDCLFTEPPRMIWSRFDWFPRLGGYSGYVPSYWQTAHQMLAGFPDQQSLEFLTSRGTSYVILRVTAGDQGARLSPEEAARLATETARSSLVGSVERFGADYLITLLSPARRVDPRPATG